MKSQHYTRTTLFHTKIVCQYQLEPASLPEGQVIVLRHQRLYTRGHWIYWILVKLTNPDQYSVESRNSGSSYPLEAMVSQRTISSWPTLKLTRKRYSHGDRGGTIIWVDTLPGRGKNTRYLRNPRARMVPVWGAAFRGVFRSTQSNEITRMEAIALYEKCSIR